MLWIVFNQHGFAQKQSRVQALKALGEDPVQRLNAREKELISANPRR